MSAVDEREAIGTLFETGWANRTPVAWPNMKYEPQTGEAYVRLSIAAAEAEQIEIGGINNMRRVVGRVFVQVFVPLGDGDRNARLLCDAAAQIFRSTQQLSTTEGRMIFREPVTRDVGGSGPHHQFNVSVPFLYDTL